MLQYTKFYYIMLYFMGAFYSHPLLLTPSNEPYHPPFRGLGFMV